MPPYINCEELLQIYNEVNEEKFNEIHNINLQEFKHKIAKLQNLDLWSLGLVVLNLSIAFENLDKELLLNQIIKETNMEKKKKIIKENVKVLLIIGFCPSKNNLFIAI